MLGFGALCPAGPPQSPSSLQQHIQSPWSPPLSGRGQLNVRGHARIAEDMASAAVHCAMALV